MPHVLWIDDEPSSLQKAAERIQTRFSAEVDFAGSISAAIKKLKARKYDLVILDIRIPLGELSKDHNNIKSFFESDVDNAGFRFLTLISSNLEGIPNLPSANEILVCSNYTNTYLEQIWGAQIKDIQYIEKSAFVFSEDKFMNAVGVVLGIQSPATQNLESLRPVSRSAPEERDDQLILSKSEAALHDVRNALLVCIPLVQNIVSSLSVIGSVDVANAKQDIYRTLQAHIDKFMSNADMFLDSIAEKGGQFAGDVDRAESIVEALGKLSAGFELSKRTMVQAEIERLLLIVKKHDAEQYTPLVDEAKAIHLLFILIDLREIHARLVECIERMHIRESATSTGGIHDEEFQVQPVLDEALARAEVKATQRRVEIRTNVEKSRVYMGGSSRSFRIILDNLLDNAIKYSHQLRGSHAWIMVRLRRIDGARLLLEIENWGDQIKPDEISDLGVRPGTRGRYAGQSGRGQGISIVKQELLTLGGDMNVTSRRSGSSVHYINVFTIIFPIKYKT